MKNNLYPWHQVALDISIANGMDQNTLNGFKQSIADGINRDIQNGTLGCWDENGEPIHGKVPFSNFKNPVPHLTTEAANKWLEANRFLYIWEPKSTNTQAFIPEIDYSMLATPSQLVTAFGRWGLEKEWFKSPKKRKWLYEARRKKGRGQANRSVEPLYCPIGVMNGLVSKVVKAKRITEDTGWRMIEQHFPRVYAQNEGLDPRARTED